VLQFVLFWLIATAAILAVGQQGVPPLELRLLGTATLLAGLLVAGWAVRTLGSSMTVLPRPREQHELITRGPFRWVRHPVYSGVLLTALGACLISGSWIALALSLCLFVLFDLKARREEAWLAQRYPQYLEYRRRTRKFVPGVY
jgi:protein-S-isoprenylcysteine O-methyltransferase Ste14